MIIKLKLDTRREASGGRYPVKVYLYDRSKAKFVSTGIFSKEEDFDERTQTLLRRIDRRANERLASIIKRANRDCENMTLNAAALHVQMLCQEESGSVFLFKDFFNKYMKESKNRDSTKNLYKLTFNYISKCFDIEKLRMDDWSIDKLREFEDYMRDELHLCQNTICSNAQRLKHLINLAVEDELITFNPTRKWKVRREATRKRSISAEVIAHIADLPLEGPKAIARDIFMLSFYLIGMNSIDMFNSSLPEDGRLYYKRSKTGRLYEIKIEPEAQAIIDKYKGEDRLIGITGRYKHYSNFFLVVNRNLKLIRPDLSMYWARHSWATIAAENDVPIDTISHALGHSIGSATTMIYINPSQRKVDVANRLVIDKVNEFRRSRTKH